MTEKQYGKKPRTSEKNMYNYLIVTLILLAGTGLIFLFRKDLRRELVWGGSMYVLLVAPAPLLLAGFARVFQGTAWSIAKYWTPHGTLLNLGEKTGIMGVTDIFFMFGVGGLAATAYEIFSPHRIRNTEKRHHAISILVFFAAYVASSFLLPWHPAWNIILASALGWCMMMIQRIDLFLASIAGAFAFFTVYVVGFILTHMAVGEMAWNLKNLTAIIYPFPTKELFYALALGLMWTPLYEYVTGKSIT